ncbi:MAG TPA: amidohydrolase family protein [Ramlibacter sp.]|nr:amidohydrolase family protein [Ramlibacter sp.]
MRVVDAQVHVWRAPAPGRPWVPGAESLAEGRWSYGIEELSRDMQAAGVDAAVLVPPGAWEGYWNDLVLEAATAQPDRFAAMVNIDPVAPGAREQLALLLEHPATRGVRLGLSQGERREAFARGELDWLWSDLESRRVPTAIFVPGLLEAAADVASRFPRLPLALCHGAMNLRRLNPDVDGVVDRLVRLADLPNVSVKASALPLQSALPYPYEDLHAPIRRIVEAFGPERVFWGSDHTRLHHAEGGADYRQCRRLFTDALGFLDDAARTLIMADALKRWLRWPQAGGGMPSSPRRRGSSASAPGARPW